MTITIYENILKQSIDNPHYITIDNALERIKTGKSKNAIETLRNEKDENKQAELKKNLVAVCFSGKFEKGKRTDKDILEHSGFVVLDFDYVNNVSEKLLELKNNPFFYALWVSPRGNGIKGLIRIADGKKHRLHFNAIIEIFPELDNSGKNESRICFESYDPDIYINKNSEIWVKTKDTEIIKTTEIVQDEKEVFKKILKWAASLKESFSKGERNIFIFKLAGACCRYGLYEDTVFYLINSEYPCGNDFTIKEMQICIKSAYKQNRSNFGTAEFEKNILVEKTTRKVVKIAAQEHDPNEPAKDIIYGHLVQNNAEDIYYKGYEKVLGINVPDFDRLYKLKKGEITALTGIGNYGKSTLWKWVMIQRILLYNENWCIFSPEENPAEEYYHDLVEMILGCDCTKNNANRPSIEIYRYWYKFISEHVFYLNPSEEETPDYICERFLECIFKHKVVGVCVDPYNQQSHDYSDTPNESKYLERYLAKTSRFAKKNDIYFILITHPKQMGKKPDGNYICPDLYDLNGGAMWINKLDNLLVYHLPLRQTDPKSTLCEFKSIKIRKRKSVGNTGTLEMNYNPIKRRFIINDIDYIDILLEKANQDMIPKQIEVFNNNNDILNPNYRAGFQNRNSVDWDDIDTAIF